MSFNVGEELKETWNLTMSFLQSLSRVKPHFKDARFINNFSLILLVGMTCAGQEISHFNNFQQKGTPFFQFFEKTKQVDLFMSD